MSNEPPGDDLANGIANLAAPTKAKARVRKARRQRPLDNKVIHLPGREDEDRARMLRAILFLLSYPLPTDTPAQPDGDDTHLDLTKVDPLTARPDDEEQPS